MQRWASMLCLLIPQMPLSDAQSAIALLPNVELVLRPGESHLGGFATADEVLAFIRSHL